jgi:hypothetical protein
MSFDDIVEASLSHHLEASGDADSPRSHRGGGRSRPRDRERDRDRGGGGGAGVLPGFVPHDGFDDANPALNVKPCRAPMDTAPFADSDMREAEDDDVSFPSIFLPDTSLDGLGREQIQHAWTRMQNLIANAIETHTIPKDLVDMVFHFYESQIRSEYSDAPPWSKRSIYNYIYSVGERQADQGIAAIYNTIELLRSTVATKNIDTGEVQANAENVKLLLSAVKAHASLIDLKKKRMTK